MKSIFSVRKAVLALTLTLGVALTLTAGTGAVAGQELPTNQTTSTPEPVAGNVGPIVIEDYRLEGGTFILTLDVEKPTAYALSDALAGVQSEGITTVPMKQGSLEEGRQTLKLDVTLVRDAGAVTLSTPRNAVRIQSGNVGIGGAKIQESRVRVMVLATALGAGLFTYRQVRNRREEEHKDAERIL
jgi:hypothetical protein